MVRETSRNEMRGTEIEKRTVFMSGTLEGLRHSQVKFLGILAHGTRCNYNSIAFFKSDPTYYYPFFSLFHQNKLVEIKELKGLLHPNNFVSANIANQKFLMRRSLISVGDFFTSFIE